MWRGGVKDVEGRGEGCEGCGGEEMEHGGTYTRATQVYVPSKTCTGPHHPLCTVTIPTHTTIPYTPTPSLNTPPPSPTHTSTITNTPPPLHTSAIPYTLPPFVCVPAVYIALITTSIVQHPVRGSAQKRFAPNPSFLPNTIWFYAISLLCLLFYYATYRATVHF